LSWVPGALTQAYDLAAQFAKAEPILRQRLAEDTRRFGADGPQTAETMGDLGLNLLKQQRWADAEPILRECLGIRSRKEPDAWTTFSTESLLGMALLGQQKYAEAETLSLSGYEGMKARENTIPPEAKIRVTRTVQRLVVLYTATGQQEKADEWRAKLPAESPHPEVPRTEVSDPMKAVSDLALGDQQAARGEHQAALASYTRALATIEQIASKDPNGGAIQDLLYRAYNSIGNLQHRMGDNQAALASHNKALPIAERRVRDDPAKTEYQTYLGGTYCNLGNAENMAGHVDEALRWYDRAAEALQAILKREPEHASTRLFLRNTCWGRAMALGRLSRHAEACESWQEAVELDAEKRADLRSAYAESLSELAWSLAARPETELRDPPRAVELAKRSIELNPNTTVAFNTLGVAQYRAGNWQAAVEALDQSVKLRAGGDAFDWLFLAMSHQRLGNQDEARKWYDQAVEWTEKQTAPNDELVRFRREAAEVLDGTNGRQAGGEDRE
ncbi:MAG TPA: tetratricopeptide repeat protein, partial [Pirellulales bacterium]|nr:tetratricopeptide repeat protein [Pirellulales bacterium]